MKIRSKALRNGVWYKTLSRAERAIVDLTIRCVEKVRSPILAKAISKIMRRIKMTLSEGFLDQAKKVGRNIAERLCWIGEAWGNQAAPKWKRDEEFIKFLGVTALNT
jgi:hypothetical protein